MKEKFDVLVAGGGLAGVSAALAAARLGPKTALVQDRPVLGGCSSSEVRVNIGGSGRFNPWGRETGIIEELFIEWRSQASGRASTAYIDSTWDLLIYDRVRREENLSLFLNTSVRKAIVHDGVIREAICDQLGTEKTLHLQANVFIDATGDGTLAFEAGAKTCMGRESQDEFGESLAPAKADDHTMGTSLLFHTRNAERPVSFNPPPWAVDFPSDEDLPFRIHDNVRQGYWWIEIGNPPFNPIDGNEKIRDELLRQLLGVWDHIKNHGDHGAKNLALNWIGMVPGKRESRRIIGDYILTENDVKKGPLFPDRIAYGGWYIDVHTPGGILAKDKPPEPTFLGDPTVVKSYLPPRPYSIPFRCLYSRNVKNLMMAGRDISVSHIALGSTREMGICAVTGQAAGVAAALCKKYKKYPRQVYEEHIEELQQLLLKQDCYIPMVSNTDQKDLAREGTVTASSSATLRYEEHDPKTVINTGEGGGIHAYNAQEGGKRELKVKRAQLFPISEDRVDSVSLLLESHRSEPIELTLGLRSAEDVWDFDQKEDICRVSASLSPYSVKWLKFQLKQSVLPHRLYWVYLEPREGVFWHCSARPPLGTTSAYRILDMWKRNKIAYAFRVEPPSKPYGPENVISGITRSEKWTNAWVSDPRASFPQYLDLDFGKEVTFNAVYAVFDTNLNLLYKYMPPFFRAPECVRDYELLYWEDGKWRSLVKVHGNYQGRRVHRFPPITSEKLRLHINGTNGVPSAHIYESRVYNE